MVTSSMSKFFIVWDYANGELQLLAWMCGTAALLSLFLGLALPTYGVMGAANTLSLEDKAHVGAWVGVYIHKNNLGITMTLSALVFLLFTTVSQKCRWVKWTGFALSVGLILLSTSKASLVMFLTIVVLLHLYRALRWNYSLAVPFFITVLLVAGGMAIWFLGNAESVLGILGRDASLTGRTDIWSAVLDKLWERPWLGYGYDVFWRDWEGESADVWMTQNLQVKHAHNGFLDLGLDLGLLGLFVFALSFITSWLRAVAWVRLTKNTQGLWPLGYLTFMILSNICESSLMRENTFWLLYVAVTLSMHNSAENLIQPSVWQHKMKRGVIKQIIKGSLIDKV